MYIVKLWAIIGLFTVTKCDREIELVKVLKQEILLLEHEVEKLESLYKTENSENIKLLLKQVEDLTHQIQDQDQYIDNQIEIARQEFEDLGRSKILGSLEKDSASSQNISGAAFSTYISNPGKGYYYERMVLPFDEAFVNIGGYFDLENKRFTCPIGGLYLFTVCLNSGDNGASQRTEVSLVMDGIESLFVLYSYHGFTDDRNRFTEQACSSVITECSEKSTVYVQCTGDYSAVVGTDDISGVPRSTFSGYFLYPL